MLSDGPSSFQRARSPFCSIQEGKVSPQEAGNNPVWFLHLVKQLGYPSCNGLHAWYASMWVCVHVCLYKKGEERVRMEGKNTNKESFSPLSSTISPGNLEIQWTFQVTVKWFHPKICLPGKCSNLCSASYSPAQLQTIRTNEDTGTAHADSSADINQPPSTAQSPKHTICPLTSRKVTSPFPDLPGLHSL